MGDQATDFLCGLLPLQHPNLFLPRIEIAGQLADVYLVRDEPGDWVLLLEASTEGRQYQHLLQKANELDLLREEFGQALAQRPQTDDALTRIERLGGLGRQAATRQATVSCTTLVDNGLETEPGAEAAMRMVDALHESHRRNSEQQAGLVLASAGPVLSALFGVLPGGPCAADQAVMAARSVLQELTDVAPVAVGIASGPITVALRDSAVRANGLTIVRPWELARQASATQILIEEDTLAECSDQREQFAPADAGLGGDAVFSSYVK